MLMKTGYKITTDLLDSSWYYFDPAGIIHGPVAFSKLRELVINGVVEVTTKVSQDKESWQPAGAIEAIGFDCIVVDATEDYQLYGPFATDFIDKSELSSGVPSTGSLFVRIGSVGDVVDAGGILPALRQETTDVQQIEELTAAKAALEKELASAKQELDADKQQAFARAKQLEELTVAKAALENELASAKQELDAGKQQASANAKQLEELTAAKVALENELASAKQELDADKQQASTNAKQLEELTAAKAALENELASAKQELDAGKQQTSANAKQLEELTVAKAALENELASAKQELDADKQQASTNAKQLEELTAAKAALENELASAKQELDADKQQASVSAKQLEELTSAKVALEKELLTAKQETEHSSQELTSCTKQIEELIVLNSKLTEANNVFSNELETIKNTEKENEKKIEVLSSDNEKLLIQVARTKEEFEQTKEELLNAVKQAQNDLVKEQIRAEQAEAARQTFEATAMRVSTFEHENAELISANELLKQQKHELVESLAIARERIVKEQQRSKQLQDAANQIKRKLSRALNDVIDDPTEDVVTLSTNEHGDEFFVDQNSSRYNHETPSSKSVSDSRSGSIICVDEDGEIADTDKAKVKQALSLEAQLQKELMLLRAQKSKKTSMSNKEETSNNLEPNETSGNRFWKLFFRKK